jgi:RecA-family ATPase
MEPNSHQMLMHLELLFGRVPKEYPGGRVEIRCLHPTNTAVKAKTFDASDLDAAKKFAERSNKEGFNIYVGVNPRISSVLPVSSCKDTDVEIAFFNFADFDDIGSVKLFEASKATEPGFKVLTGKTPSPRFHTYYELEEPCHDMDAWKATQCAIIDHFESDAAIKNPSRIMRLAGSIAYPDSKKIGKGYIPELVGLKYCHGMPTPAHDLAAQFTINKTEVRPANKLEPLNYNFDIPEPVNVAACLEAISQNDHLHNNSLSIVNCLVGSGVRDNVIEAIVNHALMPVSDGGTIRQVSKMISNSRAHFGTPQPQLGTTNTNTPKRIIQAYSIDELAHMPPKEALVKRWLDCSAMSVLYGDSGAGKTFLALDLCFHIAMGREWSGNKVRQGPVLYIAAEGGGGITKRLNALLKVHNLKGADIPLFVVPTDVDLCSADADTTALVEVAKQHKVEIIVVDTLSRALAGGDENGPKDMGAFVVHCDRVRQAVDAHMMVIHHSGKDTAKGARGHSSLRAATDTEIELVKNSFTGTVTATTKKQREQEEGQIFSYILNSVELGEDADGDLITSCVVEQVEGEARQRTPLTDRQHNAKKALLNYLASSDKKGVTKNEFQHILTEKEVCEPNYAYKILSQLDRKGVVRIDQQIIYPVLESV